MSESSTAATVVVHPETRWIDAWIRWERDSKDVYNHDEEEENDEPAAPTDTFSFRYPRPAHLQRNNKGGDEFIDIQLQGFQSESEQAWNSTGLTLWRSSEHLCDYLVKNAHLLESQKRILELGSGLGRAGILASQLMSPDSSIVLTDGDTDVLVRLRDNIQQNTRPGDNIICQQLLWGSDSTNHTCSLGHDRFDIVFGSDLVYVPSVIVPLFETVSEKLCPENGVFIMAHCSRRQGSEVTVEFVLEAAREAGFCHELVDLDDDISVYTFQWKESAKGS